ncbi:hypothetical protein CC79DRAFT_171628 [Sarocladium strictum]
MRRVGALESPTGTSTSAASQRERESLRTRPPLLVFLCLCVVGALHLSASWVPTWPSSFDRSSFSLEKQRDTSFRVRNCLRRADDKSDVMRLFALPSSGLDYGLEASELGSCQMGSISRVILTQATASASAPIALIPHLTHTDPRVETQFHCYSVYPALYPVSTIPNPRKQFVLSSAPWSNRSPAPETKQNKNPSGSAPNIVQ